MRIALSVAIQGGARVRPGKFCRSAVGCLKTSRPRFNGLGFEARGTPTTNRTVTYVNASLGVG